MKRLSLILILFAAACGTGPIAERNPYANHPDAAMAGAKLFQNHCAQCHGTDANGTRTAPSLRMANVQERSDAALFAFLTNGNIRRGMPSWSRIPDERRWQIVAYLRSLDSQGTPSASGSQSR